MAISADLGATLEAVVNDLVANGRDGSKSEVLREGVRLVQEREAALAKLYARLDESAAQFDAGQSEPLEDVVERLREKYLPSEKARRAR